MGKKEGILCVLIGSLSAKDGLAKDFRLKI